MDTLHLSKGTKSLPEIHAINESQVKVPHTDAAAADSNSITHISSADGEKTTSAFVNESYVADSSDGE